MQLLGRRHMRRPAEKQSLPYSNHRRDRAHANGQGGDYQCRHPLVAQNPAHRLADVLHESAREAHSSHRLPPASLACTCCAHETDRCRGKELSQIPEGQTRAGAGLRASRQVVIKLIEKLRAPRSFRNTANKESSQRPTSPPRFGARHRSRPAQSFSDAARALFTAPQPF